MAADYSTGPVLHTDAGAIIATMPDFLKCYLDLWLLALIGALLVVLPGIDLTVTGWFHDPFEGFLYRDNGLIRFVYLAVPWLSRIVIAGLLVFLLLAWTLKRRAEYFLMYRKVALYLLVVALVGPMFLVNTVFKDHWGRARPSQVEQFGGDKQFTRAALPTDQCEKNCSFVSGHASVGFYFLALAYVWPRRRTLWLATGTALGLGIGFVRILQGGHFLSDVVFSGIVVYLTARGIHAFMYAGPAKSRT